MKPKSILAFVVAVMVASPVVPALGQDVVPSTAAGQVERKESGKASEAQTEQPTDESGNPATAGEKEGKSKKESKKESKKDRKKAIEDDWGFRWADRPSLRLGPGTRVDFRVRLQENLQDLDFEPPDTAGSSSVDIARRRLGIDGEILNIFDYQVEGELGDTRDPWRDVYLNYKQYRLRPGPARQVQDAVQPRREHQPDKSGLRLPVAHCGPPGARTGPRRDGPRPCPQSRMAPV